ncbi:MAG: sulfur carrier protein ThiS adenylyltransferase ThiF [Anaerohalosphaera sp.]|nr:sulfur carrier protein ThiS adenylyltransferase ThiF [Anaerohalosphaera sp.]
MHVKVNEQTQDIKDGMMLFELKRAVAPEADIIVRNGAPVSTDTELQQGDQVAFITRGQIPSKDQLESLMVARHTPGVHEKIKNATVGIAGLGGLGSAIAVALARIGVGKLILVDFDVVEPSNLNRQQYFVDQIGLYKTEALGANLQRINPYVKLRTHTLRLTAENVPEIFADVDVLVEAFDSADCKAMIMEIFLGSVADKPLVMASGLAGFESSNTIITQKISDRLVIAGDLVTAAKPGTGLMAPRVGVAAHHQANAVLRLLLGLEPEGDTNEN